MLKCASCSREIPQDSSLCPYCGSSVESPGAGPTVTKPPKAGAAPAVRETPGSSSDSIDQARFTPGTMLTERYRIVGLLGKGGMGEVYRADDLKLRQPVALKFLPEALSRDARRLERFHHEVRVARQVSHPNVCRVYDIGEADGQQFISMEYVDGEDLASVLRRMGRPSKDKAIQIARQLCAGLAAAHDKGVLHRDLKPHNVMIDGVGKVRITDFGLAGFTAEFAEEGKDIGAGTPAYMAPEQLAGREVSVKSDLYSLGLILFELFAGKRLFEGATREQIERLRSTTPTTLSGLAEDIDPAVERVIQRCLAIEPSARPSSALAVTAALPGGDPLAAALAAGKTPDPEMVAAAGGAGSLRPTAAWAWLGTLLGALILVTLASDVARLHQCAGLEKPPQVLADRAGNLIRTLGYTDPPQDTAYGFIYEPDYRRHLRAQARSPDRKDNVALGGPEPITFWYRQSPHLLVAGKHSASTGVWSRGAVSEDDPPPSLSGMVAVRLDPRGRLLQFRAVPPQVDKTEHQAEGPDWLALFAQAGLDMARFEPVASTWTPPVFADTRAAWEGSYSEGSEIRIRVEAAACRGKPVYFHVLGPWTGRKRDEPFAGDVGSRVAATIWSVLWLAVLIGAAVLGIRNLRLGRADRRGAAKLAVYVLSLSVLTWLFKASHVPDLSREQHLFTMGLAVALQSAIRTWLYYLALEPYVRKLWPQSLIAWSRVLAGQFRDPLVGRDLLIGGVFGVSWWLLGVLVTIVAGWLGTPLPHPQHPNLLNTLLGGRYVAAVFLGIGVYAVYVGLFVLMLFLLLRVVLRRQWLAFVVCLSVLTMVQGSVQAFPANHYALWLLWALVTASFLFLLLRFGLFAAVAAVFVSRFFGEFPITFDFSAWYIGASLTALGAVVALGVYGFHTALAGQPLLKDDLSAD